MREEVLAIGSEVSDDDFSALNWIRWLPDMAPLLFAAINYVGDCGLVGDLDELQDPEYREAIDAVGGLDGFAYWSHEASGELSQPEAAAVAVTHDERRRYVDRAARAVGLKVIGSNRQAIELMRRLNMLERIEDDDAGIRWQAVNPLPLPSERIPMTTAERDEEDQARWRAMHATLGQQIADLLARAEIDPQRASLQSLAQRLRSDPEDVRHALIELIEDGTLLASSPITWVRADEVLELYRAAGGSFMTAEPGPEAAEERDG